MITPCDWVMGLFSTYITKNKTDTKTKPSPPFGSKLQLKLKHK